MHGFRLTPRDLDMVRWIGRRRFAEARHIAARFAMDQRNGYRRLHGLVTLELLAHRFGVAPPGQAAMGVASEPCH
jgi:hypothetical protein